MDSTETKKKSYNGTDLYENQLKYNTYVENKRKVYRVLYLIAAVVSLVSIFILPMYKYELLGKKKGQMRIIGEYTGEYVIEKYFNYGLGPHNMLNTGLMISLILLILLAAYVTVGGVMNIFMKKKIESGNIVNKLFNYGMLEIIATAMVIVLMLSMIFCKVDASGSVENMIGYWTVFVSSIVMICTSISLSSK